MRFLSCQSWPKRYPCTYEAWTYSQRPLNNPHKQDFFEFFWIESGEGIHLYKGHERRMETGYFALIRDDDWHDFSAADADGKLSLINFAFRPDIWHRVRDNFWPGKPRFFDRERIEDREFQIGPEDRERVRQMGLDLAAGRWSETNATAFLMGVLAVLANQLSHRKQRSPAPEWLIRAERGIQSWPRFAGGVPELVRLAGRSHEHVCRDCRRYLGTTPSQLVNRARLKWASMQLETTAQQIVDIAAECGFDNLGHFYKLFRETYGTTPRQYRLRAGIPHHTRD
ncbi:AraC family transcriptional regulator [Ruficoccus sp. ZRK36]|uniref:helix-turn-helix transcriptional regulator n=1 Tax=Ruficoccus sp. ZRK36 TaxID=2866311 RepID=UPI001C72D27E|nr:AraC family transcriptional regulator [Ruficoccus sp. ZRK36]QYY34990.1 AraC family transcriptional regulator [Ruficoccus sp. ZRK36]